MREWIESTRQERVVRKRVPTAVAGTDRTRLHPTMAAERSAPDTWAGAEVRGPAPPGGHYFTGLQRIRFITRSPRDKGVVRDIAILTKLHFDDLMSWTPFSQAYLSDDVRTVGAVTK